MDIFNRLKLFNSFAISQGVQINSMFLHNISYAAKRCYHHINRFDLELEKIILDIKKTIPETKGKIKTPPFEENVFYEFDAITYSARSLFENDLISDARKEIPTIIFQKHKGFRKSLLSRSEKVLIPIRNEIVHLEESEVKNITSGTSSRGTTYGFIVDYDFDSNGIELQSVRKENGKVINLIDRKTEIKKLVDGMIKYSLDLIVRNHFSDDLTQEILDSESNFLLPNGGNILIKFNDFIL